MRPLLFVCAAALAGCGVSRDPDWDAAAGSVHPPGWTEPEAETFHARYLAFELAWVLDECRDCHGADDLGKEGAPSCTQEGCHEDAAPSDCGFCHGEGEEPGPPPALWTPEGAVRPGLGAHAAHLAGGDFALATECTACHLEPDGAGPKDDHPGGMGRATVTFGGIALADESTPSYDLETRGCAGTWCHGESVPAWTDEPGSVECGDCHGIPPDMHGGTWCFECHDGVADDETIFDVARHVDGVVDVVDLDRCDTCHGMGDQGGPPPSLAGSWDPTDPGVGLHPIHLAGGMLGAAAACSDCHVVPMDPEDPGHVDDPAPAEITFGGRAVLDGAAPAYDGVRCSNTYCHGSTIGGGSATAPRWATAGPNEVGCGACHSYPPPAHLPVPDGNCALCHQAVVDALGAIIDPTRHVDGVVDFNL